MIGFYNEVVNETEVQMTVVVAIKENGTVYMGADTQSSRENQKESSLNKFKISKLKNGILIGFSGRVDSIQLLLENEDMFSLDKDGNFIKKHIVNEIIPKMYEVLDKNGKIDDNGTMCLSIILAYKNSIYQITDGFIVYAMEKTATIGSGGCIAKYPLINEREPVHERIIDALRKSTRRDSSVGAPYVLIDTENLEFEVTDDSGNQR